MKNPQANLRGMVNTGILQQLFMIHGLKTDCFIRFFSGFTVFGDKCQSVQILQKREHNGKDHTVRKHF